MTDPLKMTIRETYQTFYDKADLKPATIERRLMEIQRWERISGDPPVGDIDQNDLMKFREGMLEEGYSRETINTTLATFKAILRRIGPQETGNPYGLGFLNRIPIVKPLKTKHKKPKRVPLDDLSRMYVALRNCRFPSKWVQPTDWWRCLLVLAYTTGLRRCDLLNLRFDDIDFEQQTISFVSEKTDKPDVFALHPAAVQHLKRIWHPHGQGRLRLFNEYSAHNSGGFYKEWHRVRESAEIERFTLHDIRRTGASEIARIGGNGLASRFLQHCPRGVTEISYLNQDEELSQAILDMRLPTGFSAGPSMQENQQRKIIEQARQKLDPTDYVHPIPVPAKLWDWLPFQFRFNGGPWFPMKGSYLRILKRLATAERAVTVDELKQAAWPDGDYPSAEDNCLRGKISDIRNRLRRCLGLGSFDPIPCVAGFANGGLYQICMLPEMMKD